jgi:hypothetical protein
VANPWKAAVGKSDWYPCPRKLITDGHLRDLSASALRVYQFLLFLAQKHSAINLEVANSEIELHCGLHQETAKRAREELTRAGLVIVNEPVSGVITYTLVELGRRDSLGKPIPLRPPEFPADGGLRKYRSVQGQTARAVRQGRKLLPNYRPRTVPKKGQRVDQAAVSEMTAPLCRPERHIVSAATTYPLSQVVETSLLNPAGLSLKSSEKREISEKAGATRSFEEAGVCISPPWDEVGSVSNRKLTERKAAEAKRTIERFEQVARDPIAQKLAKKFNANILDVVDLREGGTRKKTPGVAPADFWQQRIFGSKRGRAAEALHENFSKATSAKPDSGPEAMKCNVHGVHQDWWLRPNSSERVCSRCHPDPRTPPPVRTAKHYSLAELQERR